jgi:hypothetical protein
MTDANPYAPPKALVADPVAEEQFGPCPHVELACRLLWIGFGLSIVGNVIGVYPRINDIANVASLVGISISATVSCLLLWWATRKLRQGRNWMRWLVTIVNSFNIIFGLISIGGLLDPLKEVMAEMWRENPLVGVISLVKFSLSLVAIVLLHTRTSRAWFRAKSGSD